MDKIQKLSEELAAAVDDDLMHPPHQEINAWTTVRIRAVLEDKTYEILVRRIPFERLKGNIIEETVESIKYALSRREITPQEAEELLELRRRFDPEE